MSLPTVFSSPSGSEYLFWTRDQLVANWRANQDLKRLAFGCRLNALSAIQAAGSGHIGTSFSSLDIMVSVRHFLASDAFLSGNTPDRGLFFSSKGHDAPAFYSVMHLCGELKDSDLLTLRRLGGLPGHPETITPGVPTNTGSLGMGISKAKGFIKAHRMDNPASRSPVVVMLGDGELNEGQIWESMPGAVRDGFSELIAIVDSNKIQSDSWTDTTLPMGDLRQRVEGTGWHYLECDGHDVDSIVSALAQAEQDERPSFLVAHTVKGSGVSWMESFDGAGDYYKFHSGAIAEDLYRDAISQLVPGFTDGERGISSGVGEEARNEFDNRTPRPRATSMLVLWEQLLPQLMADNLDIVIMDGDLSYDTGTHLARNEFPDRYIQAGIAEQDMVSTAGTMALSGKTPMVHSFSTFLTMRAAEHIFNNATEYSRVLYFGFLAGLVPSAPGFSHQAVSDVGLMVSVPRMKLVEPACLTELASAARWALNQGDPVYFRMGGLAALEAAQTSVNPGELVERVSGSTVAFVASGPLLAGEALSAISSLTEAAVGQPALFTMPWLGEPLGDDALEKLRAFDHVVVLENHNPALAKHHHIADQLNGDQSVSVTRMGLTGIPSNGQPSEVLNHHQLDAAAMVRKYQQLVGG